MYTVLMLLHVFITLALIIVILVQRTDADGLGGLGGGGSSMSGLVTGRGAANFMTRLTAILATAFIINSLALGIIVAHNRDTGTIAERLAKEQSAPAATPATPDTGSAGVPKPDSSAPVTGVPKAEEKPAAPKQSPSVPKPE
jgi:preprotein translocase subunit SecG